MVEPVVYVLGLDHHRTPIAIRECLTVTGERAEALVRTCLAQPGVDEVVVLSTCNRFEVIIGGRAEQQHLIQVLAEHSGVSLADLQAHLYWRSGRESVRHVFRVVASLESLVLGENQIVHQVKSAYEHAKALGATGVALNPLFQRALAVGKDVRSQTAIARNKLSIASVAVELASRIFGGLGKARLLILGAGEIAELAVTHLQAAGVHHMTICNRSEDRAVALAQSSQASVLPWAERGQALADHDIVVASTAAPGCVIDETMVRLAMRRRRDPLMLIDLAVPRDVEEVVSKIDDVYLYNVDDLEAVVSANRDKRQDETAGASALVDTHVDGYCRTQDGTRAVLLAQVSGFFQDVIATERARLHQRLPQADGQELQYGLERVGNKLAHRLLRLLKTYPEDPAVERLVRELLELPTATDDSTTT